MTKEFILKTVCAFYNLDYKELQSKNKNGKYAKARQVFYYFCKWNTIETLQSMSKLLNQCHSNAIHGIKETESRLRYIDFRLEISRINAILTKSEAVFNTLIPIDINLLALTHLNNK